MSSASVQTPALHSRGVAPVLAYRVAGPAYYRPVLVEGKVFPVARSNFFSLLEFTNSWHDPRLRFIDGRWQLVGFHEGVDITAERGTPVLSTTGGVVERVGWTFYSGLRVGVRGPDGRYYFYAHLSGVAQGIREGSSVQIGAVLGVVGNTGYGPPGQRDMFAPHLHFGIEAPGGWINPYPLLTTLYRGTVAREQRGAAELTRLAGKGNAAAWTRAARRLFMSPALAQGE
ncbi:MAG TPA: M23 family metallopeptidase [Actinomycetota bacterium]